MSHTAAAEADAAAARRAQMALEADLASVREVLGELSSQVDGARAWARRAERELKAMTNDRDRLALELEWANRGRARLAAARDSVAQERDQAQECMANAETLAAQLAEEKRQLEVALAQGTQREKALIREGKGEFCSIAFSIFALPHHVMTSQSDAVQRRAPNWRRQRHSWGRCDIHVTNSGRCYTHVCQLWRILGGQAQRGVGRAP